MDFQAQKDSWAAKRADEIVRHLQNPSAPDKFVRGTYAGELGSSLPVTLWDEFTAWAQANLVGGGWLRDVAAGKGLHWFCQFAFEHSESEALSLTPEDFAPEVFA